MKTRLITAAAAFAVAGGAMVATTGTAHATDAVRVASVQADSSSATIAAKRFNAVRPWGAARGYASLKAIKGVMTDRMNDRQCVRVTVYWAIAVKGKDGKKKAKILDVDRGTVCGKGKSKKFTSTPDYRKRPFKADGALLTMKRVPQR
ncbi:hypothetical protein [Actinomadura rudentiformis]|uniref:Uncharacterized protein n=1 Tax=Actinomadura rudentiformis TaxID=359158 RepID=A0A6H9Z265_9ACTN|nr:hypothetical protein [Actinomadura rudentiformis]KAB2350873.1 hypothetical protein F8566_07900 [Actinomadura rudentiformis]